MLSFFHSSLTYTRCTLTLLQNPLQLHAATSFCPNEICNIATLQHCNIARHSNLATCHLPFMPFVAHFRCQSHSQLTLDDTIAICSHDVPESIVLLFTIYLEFHWNSLLYIILKNESSMQLLHSTLFMCVVCCVLCVVYGVSFLSSFYGIFFFFFF